MNAFCPLKPSFYYESYLPDDGQQSLEYLADFQAKRSPLRRQHIQYWEQSYNTSGKRCSSDACACCASTVPIGIGATTFFCPCTSTPYQILICATAAAFGMIANFFGWCCARTQGKKRADMEAILVPIREEYREIANYLLRSYALVTPVGVNAYVDHGNPGEAERIRQLANGILERKDLIAKSLKKLSFPKYEVEDVLKPLVRAASHIQSNTPLRDELLQNHVITIIGSRKEILFSNTLNDLGHKFQWLEKRVSKMEEEPPERFKEMAEIV